MNLVYDVATSVIPHGVMWVSRCDEGFRSLVPYHPSRAQPLTTTNKPNNPCVEDEIPIHQMDTTNSVAVQSIIMEEGTRVSDDEFTTV